MACFDNLSFGPYRGTYGGLDLGLVEQAWFLESQAEVRDIRASRFGESIIGGIYLGQNAFIITRLKEWTPAVKAAIHPWHFDADGNALLGQTGPHGQCVESLAKKLELEALPGSSAGKAISDNSAGLGPETIVADKAIYAPRHNLQIPFGLMERDIHIVFM